MIPLYAYDGALVERASEQRIARLEKNGLVRVVRHPKGHVNRAVYRKRVSDPKAMKLAEYLGTRYSFREPLADGHICWRLKRLGYGDELRPIFLQVLTDCLEAA
jgi:hypothetical protein